MRALLTFLIISGFFLQSPAQKNPNAFVLTGHVIGLNGKFIFFSYRGLGMERIWDSTQIQNNRFQFKGSIDEPAKALLTDLLFNRTSTVDPHVTSPLFIEPGKMTINLISNNFRASRLSGSKTQNDFMVLEKMKSPIEKKLLPLIVLRNELDSEFARQTRAGANDKDLASLIRRNNLINDTIQELAKKEEVIDRTFFSSHPNSYITAFEIVEYVRHFNLSELRTYFQKMSPALQNISYGKELRADIERLSKGSAGTTASDFSAKDLSGNVFRLSDYKGKYVLLDFWASWCKPCRASNPELIQLYMKYQNEGIVFIGLAGDNNAEQKWRDAVSSDGIGIWKQALVGDIGNLYHIQGLPTKVLIDPEGKVIGRYNQDDGEPEENFPSMLKKIFDR